MAEIKTPLIKNDDGSYTMSDDHSISDILRHLIEVEGSDAAEIKTILDMGL